MTKSPLNCHCMSLGFNNLIYFKFVREFAPLILQPVPTKWHNMNDTAICK